MGDYESDTFEEVEETQMMTITQVMRKLPTTIMVIKWIHSIYPGVGITTYKHENPTDMDTCITLRMRNWAATKEMRDIMADI